MLGFLSVRDLGRLARVSQHWRMMCCDEFLWQERFAADFGGGGARRATPRCPPLPRARVATTHAHRAAHARTQHTIDHSWLVSLA